MFLFLVFQAALCATWFLVQGGWSPSSGFCDSAGDFSFFIPSCFFTSFSTMAFIVSRSPIRSLIGSGFLSDSRGVLFFLYPMASLFPFDFCAKLGMKVLKALFNSCQKAFNS